MTQLLTLPGATITRDRLQTKLIIMASIMVFGMLSLAFTLTQMRKTLSQKSQKRKKIKESLLGKYNALVNLQSSDTEKNIKVSSKANKSFFRPAVS